MNIFRTTAGNGMKVDTLKYCGRAPKNVIDIALNVAVFNVGPAIAIRDVLILEVTGIDEKRILATDEANLFKLYLVASVRSATA